MCPHMCPVRCLSCTYEDTYGTYEDTYGTYEDTYGTAYVSCEVLVM